MTGRDHYLKHPDEDERTETLTSPPVPKQQGGRDIPCIRSAGVRERGKAPDYLQNEIYCFPIIEIDPTAHGTREEDEVADAELGRPMFECLLD